MDKGLIIFDFDGTVADSMPAILDTITLVSSQYKLTTHTAKEIMEQLINEDLKKMFKRLSVPWYKLPALVRIFRINFKNMVPTLKTVDGMNLVINTLKLKGYLTALITSNSHENVSDFLKFNKMEDIFDFISPGINLFGKSRKIKKLIKKTRVNPSMAFIVGDEKRDIEAGKNVGIKTIAVTWGLQSRQLLERAKPDFIIESPDEIMKIIENENKITAI